MNKLKVLYLSSWQIEDFGKGGIDFVYDQIEALSEKVDAYFIQIEFVSVFKWLNLKITGKDINKISTLWPEEKVKAYLVFCPKISTRFTKRTNLEEVSKAGKHLVHILPKIMPRIDIVHVHVVLPYGLLGKAISEKLLIPFILQEHSSPFEMHLNTIEKTREVKKILKAATAVSSVGNKLAERMKEYVTAPSKLTTIPNLVRTDLFPSIPLPEIKEPIRLITICNRQPVKGHEVFFESISLLKKKGYLIKARMIGTGASDEKLNSLIKKFNISNEVQLEERQPKEKVAEALGNSHIYVCSSHRETFGLAPAEALCVGRPVVTTRCEGPEQFVDSSCGETVEPGNPYALAEGIERTWKRMNEFDCDTLHDRMETKFGLASFIKNTLNLYNTVLSNHSSSKSIEA